MGLIKLEDLTVGGRVYICDFRQPDLSKKPIRHIKPIGVVVVSNKDLPKNKTVYYSNIHFRTPKSKGLGYTSKIIAPFDNTGYRSYTGTMLNIFDNYEECVDYYQAQCNDIMIRLKSKRDNAVANIQREIDDITTLRDSVNYL